MLCVHADWAIGDDAGFRDALLAPRTVARARARARDGGRRADASRSGFRLHPAGPADWATDAERHALRRKARSASAEGMMHNGYLWNSGIFVWRVGDFLDEVRAHTPEVAPPLDDARIGTRHRSSPRSKPISVDVGVMERSSKVRGAARRFRLGRCRHMGARCARKAPRTNAGNVSSGERPCARVTRTTSCTPKELTSCSMACPISWSSRATD